jgi:uncharacterized protein (DUF983 family)
MSDSKSNTGVSFSGLLLVAFIVLKLTEVIDWKWVWVLAPLWISVALVLIILLIYLIVTR